MTKNQTASSPVVDTARLARPISWVLAIGGLIGLLASFVLTLEKIELFKNKNYIPSCDFNTVLSCGSVMATPQAEAFGFPNSLLGIAGFGIVTTVGFGLLAGARFTRWFWLGLQAGATFGVVFIHWLIFQSLYDIRALCPYCMVVWLVTIPIFVYVTLHNIERRHLPVPQSWRGAAGYHLVFSLTWLAAIAALIFVTFGASVFS